MSDIKLWLSGLGLEKYAPAFLEHEIGFDTVGRLTEDDLKELGFPIGPRRKFLAAAAALNAQASELGSSSQTSLAFPAPAAAERRQLTVMFVDLVGSTELSVKLDPEELREVSRAYQDAVGREVARFGGHVAKYMGDGVLVFFGYPQAHEDDAVRAIYAGLAATREVKRLGKRMLEAHGGRLRARVGIATGVVVIGDLVGAEGSEASAVTGETPNLAYRMQEAAGSGRVVVADQTRQLAGDAFAFEEPEERTLKGFRQPLRLWRVLGPSGAESRFEALHGRWLTPLVGREHELALLLEKWRQAKEGEGQVVLVSGEAGIGKSRITEVLHERVLADQHVRIRLQCSPYHTNSALHPVIEHLERAAGFASEDTAEARLDKLEALIGLASTTTKEAAPLLATLLSIPTGARYPPLGMSAERQKERTLAALTDQLAGLSAAKPVLAIVEDAHWLDPTTLELLDLMVGRAESLRMLLVITFRPEFLAKWVGRPHVALLALNRLSKRQGAEMVAGVTGGRALPPEVMEQVVARTDGVPLFVEELTRMIVESGLLREEAGRYVLDGPLPPLAIPATLHDSLMARLDRLAPAKETAQAAAAIGRTFSHDLLAAVSSLEATKLNQALGQLVEAGLVFRQGAPPVATYTFKHALVQGAAYESMLKSQRQRLHARIGSVLERQFADVAQASPEVLAHHYTEASLAEPAIRWWARAGLQAYERSSNVEAVASLQKALDQIDAQPEREVFRDVELDVLSALATAQVAARGYASHEARAALSRARDVCRTVNDARRVVPILYGLWANAFGSGRYDDFSRLTLEAASFVESPKNEEFKFVSIFMQGFHHMASGQFAEADALFEAAGRHYVEERDGDFSFGLSEHVGALIPTYRAYSRFFGGFLDQAMAFARHGLEHVLATRHPNSIGNAGFYLASLQYEMGEFRACLETSEAFHQHAVEQAVPVWAASGLIMKGAAQSHLGQGEDGVALMLKGLEQWHATGSRFELPQLYVYLADACRVAERYDVGLDAVSQGFTWASDTGEAWFTADLHRMRGELLRPDMLRAGNEIEACYDEALRTAQKQKGKTFELRAAMSLARLWAARGERARAHDVLAPIYGWFTEGFDTRDMTEAKALLEQLH